MIFTKLFSYVYGFIFFDRKSLPKYSYIEHIIKNNKNLTSNEKIKNIVAIELVEDPYYFSVFSSIANALLARGANVDLIVFDPINKSNRFDNYINTYKWVNAYKFFIRNVAYMPPLILNPFISFIFLLKALWIWVQINVYPKESIIILDIEVYDLVVDTYLRFKPSPKYNSLNLYNIYLIWRCFWEVSRANNYFSSIKPKAYISSYSTYIQHGSAVRAALKMGVEVWTFGNFHRLAKKLSNDDLFHTVNSTNLYDDYLNLENSREKIEEGKIQLAKRINGEVDSSIGYMRDSPYRPKNFLSIDVKDATIIFLHDFFDSPHVYGGMIFNDFWEWACVTIDLLLQGNIKFFLKPHPNQIGESQSVISALKARYPEVVFIDADITNKQLCDAGIALGITVYGTVSHELAFLGVPSLTACAGQPHAGFGFCKTPKVIAEYKNYLKFLSELRFPIKSQLTNEGAGYYYLYNLSGSNEELETRNLSNSLRQMEGLAIQDINQYLSALNRLTDSHGFRRVINQILE